MVQSVSANNSLLNLWNWWLNWQWPNCIVTSSPDPGSTHSQHIHTQTHLCFIFMFWTDILKTRQWIDYWKIIFKIISNENIRIPNWSAVICTGCNGLSIEKEYIVVLAVALWCDVYTLIFTSFCSLNVFLI